jgi:hypothetical protein
MKVQEREAFLFFMGVIVGIVGNLFASALGELANIRLEDIPNAAHVYWSLMFIVSSIILFPMIKYTFVKIGIKSNLRILDYAAVILAIAGIFALLHGILFSY